jgi:hypothetical protein
MREKDSFEATVLGETESAGPETKSRRRGDETTIRFQLVSRRAGSLSPTCPPGNFDRTSVLALILLNSLQCL